MKKLMIEQRDEILEAWSREKNFPAAGWDRFEYWLNANTEESKEPVKKTVFCFEGEEIEMHPIEEEPRKCPECGDMMAQMHADNNWSCPNCGGKE